MKKILLVALAWVTASAALQAQERSPAQSPEGHLIITQFHSAPFPHPQRAQGHTYHQKLFSGGEHYSDSTVALFVPPGFRETGQVDLLVHFHGWNNNVTNVLAHYRLREQLIASRRNVVLVVPQGPRDAPDSFGGKLEDPDGFKRFVDEVAETLRSQAGFKSNNFKIGRILLSGHSGGYHVLAAILDHGGLTPQIKEVWLFDALYGQTESFLAWLDQQHGRLLNIYTEDGGTKEETEHLMDILKARGTGFLAGNEENLKPAELKPRQAVFIFTRLPHDGVVAGHETFKEFLETSLLDPVNER